MRGVPPGVAQGALRGVRGPPQWVVQGVPQGVLRGVLQGVLRGVLWGLRGLLQGVLRRLVPQPAGGQGWVTGGCRTAASWSWWAGVGACWCAWLHVCPLRWAYKQQQGR